MSTNNEATNEVVELALCEVSRLYLKPNQLYRFVVVPGCKDCEDLADLSTLSPVD